MPLEKSDFLQDLLLKIKLNCNIDLSHYSNLFLEKRILLFLSKINLSKESFALEVNQNPQLVKDFISALPVHVSDFFRDPIFFLSLTTLCQDWLATFPLINIWSAGCAGGEEAISIAIWLEHHRLLSKSTLYATDYSQNILNECEVGYYEDISLKVGGDNYQKVFRGNDFLSYFENGYCKEKIKKKLLYLKHDLVIDNVFCEAHIILCRNVLIYYNKETQLKILSLLCASLNANGFICLGNSEHVPHDWQRKLRLKKIAGDEKIYRRY